MLITLLSILLMVLLHELGHAIIAKRDGIFLGFGVSWGCPCCKMKTRYDNRFKYLSGPLCSSLALPFFMLEWNNPAYFFIMVLGSSAADLFCVAFYHKV